MRTFFNEKNKTVRAARHGRFKPTNILRCASNKFWSAASTRVCLDPPLATIGFRADSRRPTPKLPSPRR